MSKFSIKDKIDERIYKAFNLFSDFMFYRDFATRRILSANKKYRDKHVGERCFILGTGPSLGDLTSAQVDLLVDEKVIAVNSIYKAEVVSRVVPTYYTLMDNNYWGVAGYTFSDIANRYRSCAPVFITDVRAKNILPNDVESIYLYPKHYPTGEIRHDISGNLSITMNVVSFSILAAVYMGFKEIYLLGCDYNLFCSRVGTHCYDDAKEIGELPQYNLSFYLKYYHLTTEFHYMIHRLCRSKKIKIVNLTSVSLLDAYPRADVSSVL